MSATILVEFVHYYDEARWQSRRGKLTLQDELLVFQSFNDIMIPLRSITKIALDPPWRILRSGLELWDLEYKPRNMLFLRLEFDVQSVESIGYVAKKTVIFGSCYYTTHQANKQMEKIKKAIYRARANAIYEHRTMVSNIVEGTKRLRDEGSKQPEDKTQGARKDNGMSRWLRGIFRPKSSLYKES